MFVYAWTAFILAGWLIPVWRWLQQKRVEDWPSTGGRIEATSLRQCGPSNFSGRRSPIFVARLSYSYSVAGNRCSGIYEREFETEADGHEFVRDLKGKSILVHLNPANPSKSGLSGPEIKELLDSRAAPPAQDLSIAGEDFTVPTELLPYLWPLAGLSAVGLMVSLWVHIRSLMGHHAVPGVIFIVLHAGAIVVMFATIFVAKGLVGKARKKDYWKVVLRGSPDWMQYMVRIFGLYAFLSFFYYFFAKSSPNIGGGANPSAEDWWGFSGHWMALYSAALAILYSAASVAGKFPRCAKGHLSSSPNSRYCEKCGQRIMPA